MGNRPAAGQAPSGAPRSAKGGRDAAARPEGKEADSPPREAAPAAAPAAAPVAARASGKRGDGKAGGSVKETFAQQANLPHLPVPALDVTCATFLETVAPLLSESELAETRAAVADLQSGVGPAMQRELEAYAKTQPNYVDAFWDDAYLLYEVPVTINVNPFFILEDDPTPERNDQVSRAARLAFSILKFHHKVRSETLSVDMAGKSPLCMSQFKKLLGSARIPGGRGEGSDSIVTTPDSRHIAVMCRSQLYVVDVVSPDGSLTVSLEGLEQALGAVKDEAEQLGDKECAEQAVGVLTSEHRATWARLRRALEAVPGNRERLRAIDEALFVVCLDEESPASLTEASGNALRGVSRLDEHGVETGSCTSRWYDKLELIVAANGTAAVNFEHTPADGHTVLRMVSEVVTDTIIKFAQTIAGKQAVRNHMESVRFMGGLTPEAAPTPRKVEFALTPELRKGMREAHAHLLANIAAYKITSLEYTGYGKQLIVSNKLSPDAFAQQAMMTAVFKHSGYVGCTYESVMTKRFLMGRTEAGRSVTPAAKAHALLVNGGKAQPAERVAALRDACTAHSAMTTRCGQGLGVDRHLYALKCCWRLKDPKRPLPKLFESSGYSKLSVTILSTSNCGNPALKMFGFGPVSDDGIGIGYIIKEKGISFSICSKVMSVDEVARNLSHYLDSTKKALKEDGKRLSTKPAALVKKFTS